MNLLQVLGLERKNNKKDTVDGIVSVLDTMIPELETLALTHQERVTSMDIEVTVLKARINNQLAERDRANSIRDKLRDLLGK